jgi:hypothetical protein
MDLQLVKINNVWQSREREMSTKQCFENLFPRLKWISGKDFLNNWINITVIGEDYNERLCVCGMTIKNSYYVLDKNGEIYRLGCNCVSRIDESCMKRYKESNKIPGTCWLCDTRHRHIPTHYESKGHIRRLNEHTAESKKKLEYLIFNKYEKYRKQLLKEKEEKSREFESKKHIIEGNIKKKILEIESIKKGDRKCANIICRYYILSDEPKWKIRCLTCYKRYSSRSAIKKIN